MDREGLECCRICGRDNLPVSFVVDVFGEEGRRRQILNKIRYCFSKQVLCMHPKDGLPKVICEECQNALSNSFVHAKKIHQLQLLLKEKYANKAPQQLFSASLTNGTSAHQDSSMSLMTSPTLATSSPIQMNFHSSPQQANSQLLNANNNQLIPSLQPSPMDLSPQIYHPQTSKHSESLVSNFHPSQIMPKMKRPQTLDLALHDLFSDNREDNSSNRLSVGRSGEFLSTPEMPNQVLLESADGLKIPDALVFPSFPDETFATGGDPKPLKRSTDFASEMLGTTTSSTATSPTVMQLSSSHGLGTPVLSTPTSMPPTIHLPEIKTPTSEDRLLGLDIDKIVADSVMSAKSQLPLQLHRQLQPHYLLQQQQQQFQQHLMSKLKQLELLDSFSSGNSLSLTNNGNGTTTLVKLVPMTDSSGNVSASGLLGKLAAHVSLPDGRIIQVPILNNDTLPDIRILQQRPPEALPLNHNPKPPLPPQPQPVMPVNQDVFKEDVCKPVEMLNNINGLHKCSLCNARFKDADRKSGVMEKHCRDAHGASHVVHKCAVCSQSFANSDLIPSHMKSHQQQKKSASSKDGGGQGNSGGVESQHVCPICHREMFSTVAAMKAHMQSAHFATGMHECATCRRMFSSRATLKRHQLTHTGQRPHACSVCPAAFTQKSVLSAHMRTHAAHAAPAAVHEALLLCATCGQGFAQKTSFEMHANLCKEQRMSNTATPEEIKMSSTPESNVDAEKKLSSD